MLEPAGDIYAVMNRLVVPYGAGIEVTARCNLDCIHCYHVLASGPELDFAELRSLMDALAALGTMELTLTGGEPFLRPDFPDILRYAVESKGFLVKIFSNLTLFTPEHAALLERFPVHRVETSILGPTAAFHDTLTRRAGSFDAVVAAIRLLRERGIPVEAKTVLMRENLPVLDDLYALAAELGIRFRHDDGIFVESNGRRGPLVRRISDREVIRDRKRRGYNARVDRPHPCNAARSIMHVSPGGNVYPCGPFPLAAGNIRETPLEDIWRHAPLMERVRTLSNPDYRGCRDCRYLLRCNGCLAMGHGLARGRMYSCHLSRKRLKPFI